MSYIVKKITSVYSILALYNQRLLVTTEMLLMARGARIKILLDIPQQDPLASDFGLDPMSKDRAMSAPVL